MSSYILMLLGASLAACMVELLVPKGDGGRIAEHVRMVAGLFLLVTLLEPLGKGLAILQAAAEGGIGEVLEEYIPQASPDEEAYEDVFHTSLRELGRRETESWVVETLEAVFGIPETGCAVEAVCAPPAEDDGPTLREVRIGLKGAYALENPHPIEAYFAERLGCPCYVTVVR